MHYVNSFNKRKPGSEYLLVVGASCMRYTLDATMGLKRSKRSSIEKKMSAYSNVTVTVTYQRMS